MIHRSLLCFLASAAAVQAAPVEFNRDIRPVLAEACFHCHGPDPGSRKATLRLDTEAGFFAKREDGPTVIKGKPESSPLYQRLISKDADEVMPPADAHKKVTPAQIQRIKTWIAEGAVWQPHWALVAPKRPQPQSKKTPWVRNEIDQFIVQGLDKLGLKPSPEADANALIRRVSLDLTGLPPSPDLISRYRPKEGQTLSDANYEKLVDELLRSPAYGEHRGRYWLDAARFGDTHGLHFDNYREMWPYRDWVIDAMNKNQPFDQFTLDQIAGDLLPNPSTAQLIATGFQRCNITTNEGGTIDEENLANYATDRVQTLGWVYMGLTTNCAQCHDHKFDPITQRDYYSLAAFFRNTTQPAKDGNVKDGKSSTLVIPPPSDRPRWESLGQSIAQATKDRNAQKTKAKPQYDLWASAVKPAQLHSTLPKTGLILHAPLNEGKGDEIAITGTLATKLKASAPLTWQPGGKLGPAPLFKAKTGINVGDIAGIQQTDALTVNVWVRGETRDTGAIVARMDDAASSRGWDVYTSKGSITMHIIDKWADTAIRVSTRRPVLKAKVWQHISVSYSGQGKAAGVKIYLNGVPQDVKIDKDTLTAKASIKAAVPLTIGQRSRSNYFNGSIQDLRIYDRELGIAEIQSISGLADLQAIAAIAAAKRSPAQHEQLLTHYLNTEDRTYQKLQGQLTVLEAERDGIKARSAITHVQEEKPASPAMANVLMRGQYDMVGEPVSAETPVALGTLPKDAPKNRLGLAKWLVAPSNPLTARVTVNRFWQEVFGQGIVKTTEDFGIMGMPPSHPELLDWLAVDFRESGWDMKRFFKQLVMSATYRQATTVTPDRLERDRDNHYHSRGPRFRMDAEMVRDCALASSGLLSTKQGGPGTRPYQPEGIWDVVGMGGSDTRNYVQDKGENLYRRSIYNFWKRMAPPANLEVFNAPSREVCTVRRERTNTPLQALVTMNDVQFVETARVLAQSALPAKTTDAVLDHLADRLLARPLRGEERSILTASYQELLAHYQAHATEATALLKVGESPLAAQVDTGALAAWTMVCNQMMNLDEVLNK
jgi:mono/diheme cytochrome c family protein